MKTWKSFLFCTLVTITGCSSTPAPQIDEDFNDDFAEESSYERNSQDDAFFEDGFGEEDFIEESNVSTISDAPEPRILPEVVTHQYTTHSSTPARPIASKNSYKRPYALNIGSGRLMPATKTCSVHQSPSSSSRIYNSIRNFKKLWVEPSPAKGWVTVQRKSGPAYMKSSCFM